MEGRGEKLVRFAVTPLGDSAVTVELGTGVDRETHRLVTLFAAYLEDHPLTGMIEYVPAYASVTIHYDPLQVYNSVLTQGEEGTEPDLLSLSPYEIMELRIQQVFDLMQVRQEPAPKLVEIPVCYGGEFGPDLEEVAAHNQLTVEEVIRIHCSRDYQVYMLGFAPGFPYLGGMDKRIAAPRKLTPRLSIPKGSVGIAGEQTGIYPLETPGGWQLIGRTPVSLFIPNQHPPTLLQAGNLVRFYPISRETYDRWSRSEA
jgi:inhibitor of KinA